MADKKIDGKAEQFIRENWFRLSSRDIAEALNVSQSLIRNYGKKLKLGSKPKVYKQRATTGKLAGEKVKAIRPAKDLDFPGMVASLFDHLTAKRSELLTELDALEALPDDGTGKLEIKSNQVESELNKTDSILLDMEEVKAELEELGEGVAKSPDQIDTIEQLLAFLDKPEIRQREGRLAAKMVIASDRVKQDWMEYTQYETGEVDCPFLCPEGILANE